MINETSFQADNLLQAWTALQAADELADDRDDEMSPEVQASFGRFSEMVNAMMDKGVLADVMEDLSDRMDSGEIDMPSDMVMDIVDSLSVCVTDDHQVQQLVAVPMSGEAWRVLKVARATNWGAAMENFGIIEGQWDLVGVVRDTEMSLLMLDVVAVGALTRGRAGDSIHGVFLDEGASGEFHGVALLRCQTNSSGCDILADVLVADEQEGADRWAATLSDHGRVIAQGPRLPREGVLAASARRVMSTLEMLRATEADQGMPGISAIMFGFDPGHDLSPDEMCWMAATYKDGTSASIQALPAALAPMIPSLCGLIEMRYGIDTRPMELADMFASIGGSERPLDEISGGSNRRLH